ncbi:unnamed protein product [Cuscuta epithymum]|uniref:Uncharacterized protein n=1 Tax=Cuscuta epithymum TaxID=186058 RepID=A0AAV0EZ08_9ASTE|nr:unnamed protein product [Cuscuta epithymum]
MYECTRIVWAWIQGVSGRSTQSTERAMSCCVRRRPSQPCFWMRFVICFGEAGRQMDDSNSWATKDKATGGSFAMRAGQGGMNRLRIFQILIVNGESIGVVPMVRPAPEPPPRFDRRDLDFAYLSFLHFNFQVKTFVFCCYFILCCKTLALGLGNERSTVIIIGCICILPNLGLVSYIALSNVINSESRPRADGYMWFFCYHVPLLNAILLI